jgi:hypothetical protein
VKSVVCRFVVIFALFVFVESIGAETIVGARLMSAGNSGVVQVMMNEDRGGVPNIGYGFAGFLNWENTGGSQTAFASSFQTFCIKLSQNVGIGGSYQFDVNPFNQAPSDGGNVSGTQLPPSTGMGSGAAGAIQKLWNGAYDSIRGDLA